MITGFADRETEKIYRQEYSSKLPSSLQKVILRKLMMIDAAETLDDLRVPPGNRLEMLQGNRRGQYSIRVSDKYRICFVPEAKGFGRVEVVDYHLWKGARDEKEN